MVSFFFTNFPDDSKTSNYGNCVAVDMYLASKKNKFADGFRFVRFIRIEYISTLLLDVLMSHMPKRSRWVKIKGL